MTGGQNTVLVRGPLDLSAEWLTGVLAREDVIPEHARVVSFATSPIGTGQMSESHRVALEYGDGCAGPASVVLKVAASDPTSRATGAGLGAYIKEVRFYQSVAPGLGDVVARCHDAVADRESGWFTLMLEDLAPAHPGDEVVGATARQARVGVEALAKIQARHWDDPHLAATRWLNAPSPLNQTLLSSLLPRFAERYAERISGEHLEVAERFVPRLDAWLAAERGPRALQHGDFRLDNLLFAPDTSERPVVAVDWQTAFFGSAMHDLAYFLGCSLPVLARRAEGEALVRRYHECLVDAGVRAMSFGECFERYRGMAFGGLLMSVAAAMLVERTDRGDDMFMTTFSRHAQHAIDLDALSLLPPPSSPRALGPAPADEGRHEADEAPLWNESWYFDFATSSDGLGGYTRIGLYPNRGEAWMTLALVRAGGPTVRIVDLEAPLPAGDELRAEHAGGFEARHICEEPLRRFTVTVNGTGESFADPAAILRGEQGSPTPISLELTWETDGAPYQYRGMTRYEIPCTVSGTVTIDGQTTTIAGTGQRDHSWGVRDWWQLDWVWCAAHLDDGTRLQCTEARLPGRPSPVMGYIQPADGRVLELATATSSETTAVSGLVTEAQLTLPELQLAVRPLAHGPLILDADDGRRTFFVRSLCRFTTPDGRSGLGWAEWNHNQRSPGASR